MLRRATPSTPTSATRSHRARILLAVLALALVASACAPKPAVGPPACAAPAAPNDLVTAGIFQQVNAERALVGLRPLTWNQQLYCLATDWSAQMAASGNLHHRDLYATIRTPAYSSYRTLGENVLRGPVMMQPGAMVAAWMASPAHRANLLSPSFTSIGIGLKVSPDGTQIYATQNFGG
jgi:uncharacterized protein YkwD